MVYHGLSRHAGWQLLHKWNVENDQALQQVAN